MSTNKYFVLKEKFACRKVNTEMILVPLRKSIADMEDLFTLNETATFIWEHIDHETTEETLTEALIMAYNIDKNTALNDVRLFFTELEQYFNRISKC